MGRKGVSKQKKVNGKAAPAAQKAGKPAAQPEKVIEKGKASSKDSKKR